MPDPSRALTFTMPLASIMNFTSIRGCPRAPALMPWSSNSPRLTFSAASGDSPWRTWIFTVFWLSTTVETRASF